MLLGSKLLALAPSSCVPSARLLLAPQADRRYVAFLFILCNPYVLRLYSRFGYLGSLHRQSLCIMQYTR